MRAPCFPESTYCEAVEITRDSFDGCITVQLKIEGICDDSANEVLALLSHWWLRWIAMLDCDFFFDHGIWQVRCRLESADFAMLPQVLRDMLAIKNACL